MAFDPRDCAIPTVYCGDKAAIPSRKRGDETYYTRKGTSRECVSKGFGAGMATERAKHITPSSIQHIRYIGDKYAAKFNNQGIQTTNDLKLAIKASSVGEIQTMLNRVLTKSNGILDKKAYNSVLLWLYKNSSNVSANLPHCQKI